MTSALGLRLDSLRSKGAIKDIEVAIIFDFQVNLPLVSGLKVMAERLKTPCCFAGPRRTENFDPVLLHTNSFHTRRPSAQPHPKVAHIASARTQIAVGTMKTPRRIIRYHGA